MGGDGAPELVWRVVRPRWVEDSENKVEKGKGSRKGVKNHEFVSGTPQNERFSPDAAESPPGLRIVDLDGRAVVLVDTNQGQVLADLRTGRTWAVPSGEEFEPLADDLAVGRTDVSLVRVELDSARVRASIPLPGSGVVSGLSRLGRTRFCCVRGSENIHFDVDAKRGILKIAAADDFKNWTGNN